MDKVLVEIVGADGIRKRKKYPIEGDSITIRKARGRRTEYKAKFSKNCLLPYTVGFWPFRRLKQKLMLREGANECIDFFSSEGVEVPTLDRINSERLFRANVIKAAGETTQKTMIPLMLWLLIAGILVLNLINLLISTGRVRVA